MFSFHQTGQKGGNKLILYMLPLQPPLPPPLLNMALLYSRIAWNLLRSLEWFQIDSYLASTSHVLGLQACTINLGLYFLLEGHTNIFS